MGSHSPVTVIGYNFAVMRSIKSLGGRCGRDKMTKASSQRDLKESSLVNVVPPKNTNYITNGKHRPIQHRITEDHLCHSYAKR